MARADAAAIAGGVPGTVLMEAAGRAVADAVLVRHRPRPVVVLCGPGNNGGDGFVAARHLQAAGWPVRVGLLGARGALKGDAAWAAEAWRGPVEALSPGLLDGRPLVVDALFGAGLARPIDGIAGEAIDRINGEALTVVAVDVPSGLHGDSGEVMGRAPFAERTVTFFRAKPGHYSLEGLQALRRADGGRYRHPAHGAGEDRAADLAERPGAVAAPVCSATVLPTTNTPADISPSWAARRPRVPRGWRPWPAVGPGRGWPPSPRHARQWPSTRRPSRATSIAECDDGGAFARLLDDERRNSMLIGPGSGVNERTRASVLAALATRRAVVLDADAITAFAQTPASLFDAVKGPVLLTPHEGEFRRLFPDLAKIPAKVERARQAARRSGATVLLKGPDTVIAAPDGRAVINVHAPASLATAGSGDVLAGIASGLMAQGLAPLAAGAAAAWLHGESAFRFGRPGLIAEDLIERLPDALQAVAAS